MIRYSIILFLVAIATISFAQNSLSGKVFTSIDNKPLPGAIVYVTDLKTGVITNADGFYKLIHIPKGTYVVEVREIGYAFKTQVITISGNITLDFTLNESRNELQEVVITGNSIATEQRKTPTPIVEVPNSYLQQSASTNVIDAISKIPGVSAITDGQSISKPVIRGLGYNRVVTLNDGIRQEGQQWGDEFGIEVDPNSVDRVEILKGPGSLAYGSDAIAGVINLIPEKPLPEGEMRGDVLQAYQTNNGLINTSLHTAGTKNGISWSARLTNIMAHAYQNKNDGYVLNSQFSNFAYDGTMGLHRNWGYSQVHFSYFDLQTGIVDGTRDPGTGILVRQMGINPQAVPPPTDNSSTPMNSPPIVPGYVIPTNQELYSYTPLLINQHVEHYKAVWDNSLAIGESRILGKFAFQQNRRQEKNDPTVPNTSNIYYLLNTVNYDVRYVSPDINNFNISVGVNGMIQDSKNIGTLLLIPEYNLFDLGVFAIARKAIGKFSLSGGIRYDTRQFQGHDDYVDANGNELPASNPNAIHRFAAYSSNFSGASGNLGATYDVSKHVYLKANLAQGFRAPNVAETGSNGIHDGTVVYEIGSPTLTSERSLQFDFATGIHSKDITTEISPFISQIANFIYPTPVYDSNGNLVLNNSNPGFPNAPEFRYTQGDAMFSGGEIVLDVHPATWPWFDFYTAYSTVIGFLKNQPESSKYLPFTPPARFQSELIFTAKKTGACFSNTYFKIGIQHTFEQKDVYQASAIYQGLSSYQLAASLAPTQAYTLFNLGVGSDIVRNDGRKICSVFISIDNLTDVAYMDYMSRFKYYPVNAAANNRVGVYNMGQNISFKLFVPINFRT